MLLSSLTEIVIVLAYRCLSADKSDVSANSDYFHSVELHVGIAGIWLHGNACVG